MLNTILKPIPSSIMILLRSPAANKCQLINGVGWKFPLGARSFISIFILSEAYGMNWAIAGLRASTKKD